MCRSYYGDLNPFTTSQAVTCLVDGGEVAASTMEVLSLLFQVSVLTSEGTIGGDVKQPCGVLSHVRPVVKAIACRVSDLSHAHILDVAPQIEGEGLMQEMLFELLHQESDSQGQMAACWRRWVHHDLGTCWRMCGCTNMDASWMLPVTVIFFFI